MWGWKECGILHGNHRASKHILCEKSNVSDNLERRPYTLPPKRCRRSTGTVCPITSAASPFSYFASRVRLLRSSCLDSPVLSPQFSSCSSSIDFPIACCVIYSLRFFHYSRCLHGALKGNVGVVRSMMAELTNETNIARGYSFLLLTWSLGYMIGLDVLALVPCPF